MRAAIQGVEYHLPEATLTNEDLQAAFPDWKVAKVRAKTGTLDDVSGLAGYAESDGKRYVFAFFFNGMRAGPGPYRAAQDRTLQRLLQP